MQKLNLYKLSFSAESGVIANIIVAAKEDLSEKDVLISVTKDVASNYSEDRQYQYNDTLVSQMMDGSTLQYLGQFIPAPGNELDNLDYTFILWQKTKNW